MIPALVLTLGLLAGLGALSGCNSEDYGGDTGTGGDNNHESDDDGETGNGSDSDDEDDDDEGDPAPAWFIPHHVSASDHDGNPPENTLDEDFETRWSALGNNQWIQYDLGSTVTVKAIDIAFFNGDQRTAWFDVEVSLDGDQWRWVRLGESSGTDTGYEHFRFENAEARYLRIVGQGNSVNRWNSITAVRVYPGPRDEAIHAVTASGHDGNRPENTMDGDPDTRWSAQGSGEWIQYDLQQEITLGAVDIAFFRGDERVAYFDIEVAGEDESWTVLVHPGQSSGDTPALERFQLPPTAARYVRLIGHGNESNDWNSLTAVRVRTIGHLHSGSDPEAVWSEDFEGFDLTDHDDDPLLWGAVDEDGNITGNQYLEIRENCGTNNSQCVRARYEPMEHGSHRIVFRQPIPPSNSYTLSYDVRFDEDFEWVRGGKLPGLGPADDVSGCQDGAPESWSMRLMWRHNGEAEIYPYTQDRDGPCGDRVHSDDAEMELGQYHALSLFVQLNQPASESNGRIELYLDGRQVSVMENVELRALDTLDSGIQTFIFSSFHGGSDETWAPSETVYAYFDNFAVYPGLRVRDSAGE